MRNTLFLDQLVDTPSLDEEEILTIWQGIDLNALPKTSPFSLFLDQSLENALEARAKNLGIKSEELAISILKKHLLAA